MFFATVKAIHLLALVLGAGASLGNIYLILARGPHDLPAPELTKALRKWYRLSALVAILTLWITGLLLALSGDGWIASNAFNAKLVFATLLLAIIVFLNVMAGQWARRGGPPGWVQWLHLAGTSSLLGAVIFAAYAFS
jgi:cytochrome bd-type quinol oxidase subunit 2